MISPTDDTLRQAAEAHGQGHVFRYWNQLDTAERANLLKQLADVDFGLMDRLIAQWVRSQPAPAHFEHLEPVPTIPQATMERADARQAWEAGEEALRAGHVGLFLVAGGQGTRLGFDGPKGCYPIGPLSGKTLFVYHAEKIRNLQRRYGCTLPWYIMVSDANAAATENYFTANDFLGLEREQVRFLRQRMVPCIAEDGRFMLEAPGRLAMNPNGHGGCIPAMVEEGILEHAAQHGIRHLSYFQVDNWAVKVADPFFIGYHVLRGAEMSSKVHRKQAPRESVGVHCLCDGVYHVIEYSELDIYPQLLETNPDGTVRFYAGNPAIHMLDTKFVQRVYDHFEDFPWHRAHKRIPFLDETGNLIQPQQPNGYKFETFVFDALQFARTTVALEINPPGEYTPTKQFDGENSVVASRQSMADYWAEWLEAAGHSVPRDAAGHAAVPIEISPLFALTRDEFLARAEGLVLPDAGPILIE